jgi:hypothetical protein
MRRPVAVPQAVIARALRAARSVGGVEVRIEGDVVRIVPTPAASEEPRYPGLPDVPELLDNGRGLEEVP